MNYRQISPLCLLFLCLLFLTVSVFAKIPRAVFPKPEQPEIRLSDRWDLLVVKFQENTDVRLRLGRLTAPEYVDMAPVRTVLAQYPGTRVERLFSRSESEYDRERRIGEQQSGRELADLNLYFAVRPVSRDAANGLLLELNALGIVECVYPEPLAQLPTHHLPVKSIPIRDSVKTHTGRPPPSFVDDQDYLEASPVGVNAYAAWSYPGGRGHAVKCIDVEAAWNWDHIDLPDYFYLAGDPWPGIYEDHGTAVLGEICSQDNGFGTTGIAPETAPGAVAIDYDDYPDSLAAWFDLASHRLDPGDVWLIELQGDGPADEPVAMEYWQANFDAIAASTALGRICVEAAGNGGQDLDDPIYEGRFDRSVRDSGAIMVAAGTPYDMIPEDFTNYGSRIDANGWGSQIVTTGIGDLYGDNEDEWYTADFGGTSGASPMIVGVCCCAQSIYKTRSYGAVIEPVALRTAITSSGAPQPPPADHAIGPRPDLEALLQLELFDVTRVSTDRTVYMCVDTLIVIVVDYTASGTVDVFLSSGAEPSGETVTLEEIDSGLFQGFILLDNVQQQPGDDLLCVHHGDVVTAEYDNGSIYTGTAAVDCVPPVISDVVTEYVDDQTAVISWITDEPATSVCRYGQQYPFEYIADVTLVTEHRMILSDLLPDTDYLYYVSSTDKAGNFSTDNNGGAYYTFTTWIPVTVFREPMDLDPGWWISGGEWAFGIPGGQGGATGNPDPVSGNTGDHVYGYNLSGDYTNNMPAHHLVSCPIDIRGTRATVLEFQRWLGVERRVQDQATLSVSTDGETWEDLWINPGEVADDAWTPVQYDLTPWLQDDAVIRLRWTMGPTNETRVYCGWNIDDVVIRGAAPAGYASPTPVPTATPTPTPTPTMPCDAPGVDLELPRTVFVAGDIFQLTAWVCNPGDLLMNIPLFVILDVYGELWFAPGWRHYPDQGIDYFQQDFDKGLHEIIVLESFAWPGGAGSADGLYFHGALTDPDFSAILGTMDSVMFGYQ